MSPPQQWKMLSEVSFAFQQRVLMHYPAPVALLAFWQGQSHISHIPRNVLSQQRHFPL